MGILIEILSGHVRPACALETVDKDFSSTPQSLSDPGTAHREVLLDPKKGAIVDGKGEKLDPSPLQLLHVRPHTIGFRLETRCIQKVGHSLE